MILRKEIFLALSVKVVLLFGLQYAFFSHPMDKQLVAKDVANHVFHISNKGSVQ